MNRPIIGCTVCQGEWEPCDHILGEITRLTHVAKRADAAELENLHMLAAIVKLVEAIVNFPGWQQNDRLRRAVEHAQARARANGTELSFLPVKSAVGGTGGGRGTPTGAA